MHEANETRGGTSANPTIKRRILPKATTEPERRRCRRFTDLPVEIIGDVICYLEPTDAVNIISTCKAIKKIMHPEGSEGRRNWRILRQRLGWPDPTSIGMTDYKFIQRQYGRGCDFCVNAPRIRTPKWEFRGLRLCTSCIESHTVRDYVLTYDKLLDRLLLPSILIPGPPRAYNWPNYRLYLKASVQRLPIANLNFHERKEMERSSRELEEFANKIKTNTHALHLGRRQKIASLMDSRKREVDSVMQEMFPTIHPKTYGTIGAYQNAIKRRTPFTKRSKLSLVKSITKQLSV